MDKHFLKQLDLYPERDMYAKIISLDLNDLPLEVIEGKVSGGSVNVDGNSAVRRTCSLTLIAAADEKFTDEYWAMNTKFELYIGLANHIDPTQPPVIWFKQGHFLIHSFTKSIATNNISISIQGKDKMCRLNGEMNGAIYAQTDFGQIEEIDNTDANNPIITLTKLPIKDIIRNAVKEFGQERDENIIINDLDDFAFELWEYIGKEPIYYFREINSGNIKYIALDQNIKIYSTELGAMQVSELADKGGQYYSTNSLDPEYNYNASMVYLGSAAASTKYNILRVEQDSTAGYHQIPLVYNTDLILNAGETVTSLLDKLKNMLGNFEYFYDLNGRFIFQKKNDYVQELFSTSTGALTTPLLYNDMYAYSFDDDKLFTSISPSPNIGNIKNDFSVWGSRESNGQKLPIHARCAIDKKPTKYISPWEYESVKTITNEYLNYCFNKDELQKKITDWFHPNGLLIIDFNIDNIYKTIEDYQEKDAVYVIKDNNSTLETGDFKQTIEQAVDKDNNLTEVKTIVFEITRGDKTEEYSYDEGIKIINNRIQEFELPLYYQKPFDGEFTNEVYDWRELIYQMAIDYRKHNQESDYLLKIAAANPDFVKGYTGYEQYYTDMEGFWRQLYCPRDDMGSAAAGQEYYWGQDDEKQGWNKNIHIDPTMLNFWFEFIDTEGDLSKYAVCKIGDRSKVVNENSVTSIYYKGTPEVQYIISGEKYEKQANTAYTAIQITTNEEPLFSRSAQGISAIEKVNELIQTYSATASGITVNSIPIFYLQPNTRIFINGYGDYTITKISFNLNYNGTMSLSANKIFKQFI